MITTELAKVYRWTCGQCGEQGRSYTRAGALKGLHRHWRGCEPKGVTGAGDDEYRAHLARKHADPYL